MNATTLVIGSERLSMSLVTTDVVRVSERSAYFAANRDQNPRATNKVTFTGVDGCDVYNITAPFRTAGRTVIAGRVERRHDEHSTVIFFEEVDEAWQPVSSAPTFALQDPFFSFVKGELIFGGVQVYQLTQELLGWRTILYRGSDIFSLGEFFVGPNGMKDIRLCDLQNGRIGVFTRPQGIKGGRGTIGYTEVARLDDLTKEVIDLASLIENMFHPQDWGGVNETHLLPNGEIGVLAHAACYEHDDVRQSRHYYATAFKFCPDERTFRDYRVIASRDQFAAGPAKRPDLVDVIFSSGLVRHGSDARLYAGVSDAEAHWIDLPDPFQI